jgi:Ca-activated chloride channel homolog
MLHTVARAVVLAALGAALFGCGRSRAPATPGAAPVSLEASLDNRFVKSGAPQAVVARVALAAQKRAESSRPPVNLALLVDTSGSMEGRAIADARAASLALLDSLTEDDRLAVVSFDSQARVLLPSTRLADADAKELRAQIGAMKAVGTTDMAAGLRLALGEVEKGLSPDGVNRVVLVGDGVPNDDRDILPLVAQAAAKGVSVTALGLGDDYDETLMGHVAQRSGGRFFYVEDSTKVASFFADEVTRLHGVVARGVGLELRPGPGVSVRGVVGRPFRQHDRGVMIDLGDLSFGEQQEIVVELTVSATKRGANVEVLDAVLHYADGVGGGAREERAFVGAKSTEDEASLTQGKDAAVGEALERAKDAAATLEMLQMQREQGRSGHNMPTPSPQGDFAAPAAPAPKAASGLARGPTSAAIEAASPVERRRLHDRALRSLQAR